MKGIIYLYFEDGMPKKQIVHDIEVFEVYVDDRKVWEKPKTILISE